MHDARSVITIGNFDGVHAGHAALIRRARALADAAGDATRVVALAFDPHPLTRLRPGSAPAVLTPFERRRALLLGAGCDLVQRLVPSDELLSMTPEAFVERVLLPLSPIAVVEGADFRFGKDRAGSVETLREIGARRGFAVHVVEPVEVVLEDHQVVPASSSLVRWLLSHGRVRDAAAVLGRAHEVEGVVVPGDRRGRTLGIPTANVRTEGLVPGDGVYACAAGLPDGSRHPAAVNIGERPTFAGRARTVEAHVIGWSPPGWAPERAAPAPGEYGWPIRLEFVAWLRDQMQFSSPAALVEQVRRDVERAAAEVERRARAGAIVRAPGLEAAACP